MYDTILVPLDGTDESEAILPHVINLARHHDARVVLLRTVEPIPLVDRPEEAQAAVNRAAIQRRMDAAESYLADLAERLADEGFDLDRRVVYAAPAAAAEQVTEEENIDLIAMTTHARAGVDRLFSGSVAEDVLRRVTVPVMLLHAEGESLDLQIPANRLAQRLAVDQPVRIAVATDGSPFAQRATAFAGKLARGLGNVDVRLLAAIHEDGGAVRGREILAEARDLLGEMEPRPRSVPLVGYADEVIIEHLTDEPADLLVIGAFGDRGPSRFHIGSTAHRLATYAPTSVLMAKGHRPDLKNVLLCSAVGDVPVVDVGCRLAQKLDARLQLLHVVGPSAAMYLTLPDIVDIPLEQVLAENTALSRHLETCLNRLESAGFGAGQVKVRRGPLPDAIFDEARSGHYDLIVVGSQAGPVRDEYWMGSIADRIVRHAHRSVLVARTTRDH